MKAGILGSGMVGRALALGTRKLGYETVIGTRNVDALKDWLASDGQNIKAGSLAEAAADADLIFLATNWGGTQNALQLAGADNLKDRVLIDVTNPLQSPAAGGPPALALGFPDSGGAQVQRWAPQARVVKCFNCITAPYMANPDLSEGKADMFLCGNDAAARTTVLKLCQDWGWHAHDMGDIQQAYLLESLAMLWIRYGFLNNHWTHAFKLLMR